MKLYLNCNENLIDLLLLVQRAKRWADRMDDMTSERMRLAGLLMDTLENIEKESGIFLIKPVYTYRAPYVI